LKIKQIKRGDILGIEKILGVLVIIFTVISLIIVGVVIYNTASECTQDTNVQDIEPFTFQYFEENGKLAPELQSPLERFEGSNE
jgi:cell division protein FtsL